VPARQAYVVGVVGPAERTAAASYTNTARAVVRPGGALGGGYVNDGGGLSSPFIIGGALKIVYDLILLGTFRRVHPKDRPHPFGPPPEPDRGSAIPPFL